MFTFQLVAWSVFLISMGAQVFGQVSLFASAMPALFIRNVVGFAMFPIYLDGEGDNFFFRPWPCRGWVSSRSVVATGLLVVV